MSTAVKIKGISKSFANTQAVKGANFSVNEGEIICVLGESGSGKTTLLRLLAGLEDADAGSIEICGETITGPADHLVPGYDFVSLMFQDFKLEKFKTVSDNIASRIYYLDSVKRQKRIERLLKLCLLTDKVESFPTELSGGQQQRLSLALALAKEPRVILMDEPFSNVDSRKKHTILQQVVKILKRSGVTVIMVTHDRTDAMSLADKIMIMRKGRIIQKGTPAHLYANSKTKYAAQFLGPVNFITLEKSAKPSPIRPENISLNKKGRYNGTVIKTVFMGMHYHIYLQSSLSNSEIMLYSPIDLEVGSAVRFDIHLSGGQG